MGGQQSTRRISIDNEGDPASVIKVSEAVAGRLKGSTEDQDDVEEEVAPTNVKKPVPKRFRHVPVPENIPFQGIPYITSRDLQQVIEEEVMKNNQYWEKRIGQLQKTHEQMNRIMEDEYIKTSEEIKRILPRSAPPNGKLPCQGGKASVTKCYKSNPKQTLNCAAEVEKFASCMTNTRIKLQEEDKL